MATNPDPGDPTSDEKVNLSNADVRPAQPDHTVAATRQESIKGVLERLNRIIDTDYDTLQVADDTQRKTQFDELVVASETNSFSLNSQWNALNYRNTTTSSGSGSVTNNTQGEYDVSTGTTANSSAALISNESGVYEPGTSAVAGIAVRSTQGLSAFGAGDEIRWGYYDDENGFGFGIDDSGVFVFFRRAGTDTKVHRDSWSNDPLDGTGPSGFTLDVQELLIWQIYFTWYGSGEIAFSLAKRTSPYKDQTKNVQLLHVYDPVADPDFQGPSVLQPDLPFTSEASNGANGNDIGLAVTGRAFRRLDQSGVEQRRQPVESLADYTNLTQGSYVPVFGLTKRDTFNGFPNQVNVRSRLVDFVADEDASVKVEIGTDLIDTANSTLSEVPGWGSDSCCLTAKGGNIAINAGVTGYPVSENIIRGSSTQNNKSNPQSDIVETDTPIGRNQDVVVFVRQDTANTTTVSVTHYHTEAF